MPVQHDTYDHWRHLIAYILHISNGIGWIRETDRDVWHKLYNKKQTVCRARITWPNEAHLIVRRLNKDPEEQKQCIVCQFDLSHLQLIEGQGSQPKPPKPPPGPKGPPTDYRPNPPAGALEVPIAQVA